MRAAWQSALPSTAPGTVPHRRTLLWLNCVAVASIAKTGHIHSCNTYPMMHITGAEPLEQSVQLRACTTMSSATTPLPQPTFRHPLVYVQVRHQRVTDSLATGS